VLIEEKKLLQEQVDGLKKENEKTVKEVREESRTEIARIEAKCKEEMKMVEDAAKKEVDTKCKADGEQLALLKERLQESTRTVKEK
jgi:hypothetical protein